MQGILLQVIRFGFLILLWLFVYAIIRAMRSDLAAASGTGCLRRPAAPPDASGARTVLAAPRATWS